MSASSERNSQHAAHHARLHGNTAWCSARSSFTKFLQIDFPRRMEISAVLTQGHRTEYQWLYKYKLRYSLGAQWLTYKESGKEKVRRARLSLGEWYGERVCYFWEVYGLDLKPRTDSMRRKSWGKAERDNHTSSMWGIYVLSWRQ